MSAVNAGSDDSSEAHLLLLRDGARDNSWLSTAVIIVCSMAGVGMLSLPGAMQLSGWVGLLSMLALVALSAYMAVLMGDICQILYSRGEKFEDYADIGYLTAGVFGRTIAQVGVYFSLFGVGVVFLILAGVLVNGIIPSLPPGFITIVAALVLGPICIFPKTFAELPFVGYVGLTATATTVVLASTFSLVYYHSPAWQDVQVNYTSINISSPLTNNTGAPFYTHVHGATWMSQIRALSVFSFAFGGTATLPSLWLLMRKREQYWPRTMYLSYGATTLIVSPMAVVGYMVYGDRLAQYGGGITTILQTTGPAGDVAARICSALMVVHVLATFPLLVNILFRLLERTPLLHKADSSLALRALVRSVLLLLMLVTSLAVPYFLDIVSIISSLGLSTASYAAPALFYWRVARPRPLSAAFLALVIVFSLAATGIGLYFSCVSLWQAVSSKQSPFAGIFHFGG